MLYPLDHDDYSFPLISIDVGENVSLLYFMFVKPLMDIGCPNKVVGMKDFSNCVTLSKVRTNENSRISFYLTKAHKHFIWPLL